MSLSKCRLWLTVAAALWWTAQTTAADLGANAMAAGSRKANHERAAEPTVKTALLPLPPGAVEPSGWLRDWAQAAREGITGHLDEWHPVYRDGWKGSRVDAPNARPDGTGWPLEPRRVTKSLRRLKGCDCQAAVKSAKCPFRPQKPAQREPRPIFNLAGGARGKAGAWAPRVAAPG